MSLSQIQIAGQSARTLRRYLISSLLYSHSLFNPQMVDSYGYVQNNPVRFVDRYGLTFDPLDLYDPSVSFKMRLASVNVGFSYAGQDYSVKFYDETGWHFPTTVYRGISTTLLGFGGSVLFEDPDRCASSNEEPTITVGQSKYLGLSTSLDGSMYGANVGLAIGLPGISVSKPLNAQEWNELISPLELGP